MKALPSLMIAALMVLTPALTAFAAPSFSVRPTPRASLPARANERAVLRQANHADRLARVQGIVRGMTNKLDNLSQRLDRQLDNVERRLAALRAAGHDVTVDAELTALRQAIATTQTQITQAKDALAALPDSDSPREKVAAVRAIIRNLRVGLEAVREAFQALRLAVSEDVRTSPIPSVSPAP